MAMEYLEDACRLAADVDTETIRIAANNAVSLFWLTPRLRRFGLGEHSASVSLFTSDNISETLDPANDLVISYGHGDNPGWSSELLFVERLVPVAAPAYLEALGIDPAAADAGANWRHCQLLEYDRLAPDWVNWRLWLEHMPASPLAGCTRTMCRNYAQAIGAALAGKGLALGSLGLIDDELAAGRLRVLGGHRLQTGRAYYLSQPRRSNPGKSVIALKQLLLTPPA